MRYKNIHIQVDTIISTGKVSATLTSPDFIKTFDGLKSTDEAFAYAKGWIDARFSEDFENDESIIVPSHLNIRHQSILKASITANQKHPIKIGMKFSTIDGRTFTIINQISHLSEYYWICEGDENLWLTTEEIDAFVFGMPLPQTKITG